MSNTNYILTSEGYFLSEDELYHWGVKGMKWGVRKKIDYAGEGIVSRKKQKLPGYVKGGPAKKPALSTSGHARKMGDAMASAVNSVAKAKKQTNKGKKKASKALSNAGSKTVKAVSKTTKIGMSFAQSM